MKVPPQFELEVVARSHGWYDLAPFSWDADRGRLSFALEIKPGQAAGVDVTQRGQQLTGRIRSRARLTPLARRRALSAVRWCLRLDEDLAEFHRLAAGDDRLRWVCQRGAGRILRAPAPFEDLVKILLTTNCSWSLTRTMVSRLVDELGAPAIDGRRAFPGPAVLARRKPAYFRQVIRAGYRSEYLARLARAVHQGSVRPESWAGRADVTLLRKEFLALPGIGPYAAAHLLRLTGHYQDPGLDSWCRARFQQIYQLNRVPNDAAIIARYRSFGRWLGLALWMDLTREWHVSS
jgi:3-methyladenine DNA glycosylase/8-oxoguanine DNA glycosylase